MVWLVPYEEIRDSFRLAMEAAGIPSEKIVEILITVEDFAVNQLGED